MVSLSYSPIGHAMQRVIGPTEKTKCTLSRSTTILPYYLRRSLTCIDLLRGEDIDAFLSGDRVTHVYGKVHSGTPVTSERIDLNTWLALATTIYKPQSSLEKEAAFLDRCWGAANGIRVIDPYDKEDDDVLARAQALIRDAEVVYILGYGFDENNNRRLGLETSLNIKGRNGKPIRIMFTNYDDVNSVNKRASYVCFGSLSRFLGEHLHNHTAYYAEKSTRKVYEAIEKDFDAFEIRGRTGRN
jgi:hypothetical protein